MVHNLSIITSSLWQWWWCRGTVLALGVECPRFNSQSRLNFSSHRIFHFRSVWHLPWTSGFSSLILSYFLYLSFPVQFAGLTITFFLLSSSLLNYYASCAKLTNGLCSLSLFTITVSVGTQLLGQNWCSSSLVEAGKKSSWQNIIEDSLRSDSSLCCYRQLKQFSQFPNHLEIIQ